VSARDILLLVNFEIQRIISYSLLEIEKKKKKLVFA